MTDERTADTVRSICPPWLPSSASALLGSKKYQIATIVCHTKPMITMKKCTMICLRSALVAWYARATLPVGPRSASPGAQLAIKTVQRMTCTPAHAVMTERMAKSEMVTASWLLYAGVSPTDRVETVKPATSADCVPTTSYRVNM